MGNDESIFRFGAFELQPTERRLLSSGRPLQLGPRAFDLLVALVERAGHLVTKDELLERVWPKLVVEENNLQVQVSALRKLLGPEAIATVPGQGYRFSLEREQAPAALALVPAAPTHNLPEPITSFVGRTRELAEIGTLLGSHRLLTLLGVGGIGKTRLALRLAAEVMGDYPGGAWLVELAPLADPRLVPQAVASVLGVKEQAGRPVVEALVKFVKDRRLLLILDNCEHLAQACAELVRQLLRSGPEVKILATSRDYLHVAGETTYPVPPLGVPEPQTVKVILLMQSEAVQLFADRAVASQSAFHVTPHNAPAIAAICRHLEGIPLALELAAARVRALSVQKVAERLGDRFRLLTGGDRTALPRQQTLRACIDWSHELLTKRERALLRRLSVFAGGWTLEAAEAVGAGGEVEVSDVLDLLTRLVEKSLVVLEADGERYRLLETVRQYAQERLADSGEGDDVRARHLAFYLALAEEAQPMLEGRSAQGTWLARLDPERENFLAAHAWCDHADGGAQLGLRLTHAVMGLWLHRGMYKLGYDVTVAALARSGAQERCLQRCKGLTNAAILANATGSSREAQAMLEESLAIVREIGGTERTLPLALKFLATQLHLNGKRSEARRLLEEALPLARELEKKDVLSMVLTELAELNRWDGDSGAAETLLEEALALARGAGHVLLVAGILVNLAALSIDRRSGHGARGMLREALAIIEKVGSKPYGLDLIEKAAGLAALFGEWERAACLYGAALVEREQAGEPREPVDEAFLMPLMAKAREAMGEAAFDRAAAAGRALSYEDAMAEIRAWMEGKSESNRPQLRVVP